MFFSLQAFARRFDRVDLHIRIVEEGMEQADRIRSAADAGHQRVGQATFLTDHLFLRFEANDRLKVAHQHWIGMGASRRADDVEGVMHVGDPVAQCLVHRILQGARAGLHRPHFRAQQFHPEHIGLLTFDIHFAHVDHAGQAETGGHRGGRHAMLAGAGLGDDARLAHALGQQDLADAVVDLVRASVVQLIALEIDFRSAEMIGHPLGVIEWAGSSDIVIEEIVHLGLEGRIGFGRSVMFLKIENERHQRLGDKTPAEFAEMALLIGAGAIGIDRGHGFRTSIRIQSTGRRHHRRRAASRKARILAGSFW